MQARFLPFSAKVRRFKYARRKLNKLLKSGEFHLLNVSAKKHLLGKLKQRFKALGSLIPAAQFKAGLASIALLAGAASASSQSFGPLVESPFGLAPGFTPGYHTFADIDGDGDQDLFVAFLDYSTYNGAISFFENTGTPESPEFAADAAEQNPFGLAPTGFLSKPAFADLDGDGDLDLLTGWIYTGGYQFFENTGSATAPAFAAPVAGPFGLSSPGLVGFPTLGDVDNDGDVDMISGTYADGFRFYENTGTPTAPAFASPVVNPFGIQTGGSDIQIPVLADLDNDGDLDLFFMGYGAYAATMYFAENTGTPAAPSFSAPLANPFGINIGDAEVPDPFLVDINNDGDLDLFMNDYAYGFVRFQENVEIDVPVAPTAANNTVTMNEDEVYAFTADDFEFSDGNSTDQLQAVEIVSLPAQGSLKLGASSVNAGQIIEAADIPNLLFDTPLNAFGSPFASFGFKVSDGQFWSADSYVMTINVGSVNDVLMASDGTITAVKDTDYSFESSDFTYTDVENDPLLAVKIVSLPAKGDLRLNGIAVVANQIVGLAQLGTLTYRADAGEFGDDYTSFNVQLSDGGGFSETVTMTVDVQETSADKFRALNAVVKLSPNPVTDRLTLEVRAEQPLSNPVVAVFDAHGKQITNTGLGAQAAVFTYQLDVSQLPAGNYLLRVQDGQRSATQRFVVQF